MSFNPQGMTIEDVNCDKIVIFYHFVMNYPG